MEDRSTGSEVGCVGPRFDSCRTLLVADKIALYSAPYIRETISILAMTQLAIVFLGAEAARRGKRGEKRLKKKEGN